MNIIRKYKISKLINKPLTGVDNEIIELIQSWLKDLIPFQMDEYPDSIFYMKKDGRYVLELNTKNKYLYVRWNDFWCVLSNKFSLNYQDIQNIIKFLIEETFKQEVEKPSIKNGVLLHTIEEAFKKAVSTPSLTSFNGLTIRGNVIEEAFKQNIGTPTCPLQVHTHAIEEVFKQKGEIIIRLKVNKIDNVEEAFKNTRNEYNSEI